MAKRKSSSAASALLKKAAAKMFDRGKDCGWCSWIWTLVIQKKKVGWGWKKVLDNCATGCKCRPPAAEGRRPFEVVKKGCVPNREVTVGCADHDCLWEVQNGRWVPIPGNDCPGGCICPMPTWRPTPFEPPTYMQCTDQHHHHHRKD